MAETTKIEWTATINADGTSTPGATFNPWTLCTPISAGCQNCYASALHKRFHGENYKAGVPRERTSESYWKQPLKWNRDAEKSGVRKKVFCASLADVFDAEAPDEWRIDLFDLIRQTPHLDWLLLTKRPEKIRPFLFANRLTALPQELRFVFDKWLDGYPPANVWLGTSIEDQKTAKKRIWDLINVPAKLRFLSVEPLLKRVYLDLGSFEIGMPVNIDGQSYTVHRSHFIHWVIVGGESGPNARPFEVEWARHLKAQCETAGVPFFLKQLGRVADGKGESMGDWPRGAQWDAERGISRLALLDKKGGDESEWPEDLRVRQFPEVTN